MMVGLRRIFARAMHGSKTSPPMGNTQRSISFDNLIMRRTIFNWVLT